MDKETKVHPGIKSLAVDIRRAVLGMANTQNKGWEKHCENLIEAALNLSNIVLSEKFEYEFKGFEYDTEQDKE